MRHWESIYYCEHVIYMHNTNSYYAKKLSWIPPLYLGYGPKPHIAHQCIYGYTHPNCSTAFYYDGFSPKITKLFDYEFIDCKISHRCQENLMTRWRSIFKIPNIRGRNQRLVKKLDEWLSFRSSHYKKNMNLKVQKYNSLLKLNSSTTRRL